MLLSFRAMGLVLVLASGCGGDDVGTLEPGRWDDGPPPLPSPVANNAVAAIDGPEGCTIYSALGIGAGLEAASVRGEVLSWHEGDAEWAPLPPLSSETPRVAASAVALGGRLYVLGGYSIAAGGEEVSFDTVDVFDPGIGEWQSAAPMPVAIDDAVAVAWRDRYLIVVSGWSTTGSVASVQLYDAEEGSWSLATDFPGTPVFGHAGAIAGDSLLVIDGVATRAFSFELVNQNWMAQLDPEDPTAMSWTDLGQHPGPARYRAAGGSTASGQLWFHGGTEVPYNFDGLAYEGGEPAEPLATTLVHDPGDGFGELGLPKPVATMDHRALARCGETLYVVGGLTAGPTVSAQVWRVLP